MLPKKTISLAGVLVISVALCGTLAAGPETEAAAEPDELKFKWLTQFFWAQDTELNQKIFDMAEDYMGMSLNIEWELPDEFDGPTYFASGDYADIVGHWDANAVNQLGEDGLLVNLLEHDLPFYGPIIEQGYNRLKLQAGDGGIYNFSFGFDTHAAQAGSTQWVWVWRHDIFKQHGIAIPETLEETYQAAQQLKELYPNSYPMGSYVGASWYSVAKVIFMVNRTSQALYYNGSEFVLGPIHDEDRYRASLEYLNRFYEEGLLDPEFFTQTGDQSKEKTVNGTYFFVPNHFAGNILRFNTNEVYPGLEWGWGVRPKGLDGRAGWIPESNKQGAQLWMYGHVVNSKHPRADLLVKLFDYFYSPEMINLATWGIEGETHQVAADGSRQLLPWFVDLYRDGDNEWLSHVHKGFGLNNGWGWNAQVERPQPAYENGSYGEATYLDFTARNYNADNIFPNELVPEVLTTMEDRDFRKNAMAPIETLIDENVLKFITGEKSFSEWDDFIASIEGMGKYEQVLATMNSSWQEIRKD